MAPGLVCSFGKQRLVCRSAEGVEAKRIISSPRTQLGFLNGKTPVKGKTKITKHSEEAHLELLWNFPLKISGREALGQFGKKSWAAV